MFGMGGSFCAMQMLYIMRHDVRSKYGIRTKQALKAPGNYREVPPQQHDDLLKGTPQFLVWPELLTLWLHLCG